MGKMFKNKKGLSAFWAILIVVVIVILLANYAPDTGMSVKGWVINGIDLGWDKASQVNISNIT